MTAVSSRYCSLMASLSLSTLTSAVLIPALRDLTQVFPSISIHLGLTETILTVMTSCWLVGDEAVPREAVHLDCDGLVGLSDQPELPHLAGVNVAVLGVGAVSLKMNIVAWAELTPDSRHYR